MFSREHVFERGVTLPGRSEARPPAAAKPRRLQKCWVAQLKLSGPLQHIPKRSTNAHRWHDATENFESSGNKAFLVNRPKIFRIVRKKNHKQVQAIFNTKIYLM